MLVLVSPPMEGCCRVASHLHFQCCAAVSLGCLGYPLAGLFGCAIRFFGPVPAPTQQFWLQNYTGTEKMITQEMKHKSTKTIQNLSTASILCPIFNLFITTTISIMNSSPHCISHHLGIQSLESAGGVCKQNTLAFLVYESGEARFSVWTRGPQTERSAPPADPRNNCREF